uniref:Uncharacterized protein n=1 Tax=Arundo donax TaxID=35708 RepID=A0A0A9FQ10_ARUDO
MLHLDQLFLSTFRLSLRFLIVIVQRESHIIPH